MDLAQAREWFAEDLRLTVPISSDRVIAAFGKVPRERFLGPPPWLLVYPDGVDADNETDDPHHLYHDVLVAIDRKAGVNNGQPSLWARLYDKLKIVPGENLLHIGAGTGYYTAVLAEMTGPDGRVTGLEFDARFAGQARDNLADRPHVALVHGDGCVYDPGDIDVIIVNAGVTHPQALWLDALTMGGRLLVPLTNEDCWGHFLMVTRKPEGFAAAFVSRVGIIPCASHRDPAAAGKLEQVFRATSWRKLSEIQSLRRDGEPDDSCVMAGPGYWLSSVAPG